jgi:hypothetical protein
VFSGEGGVAELVWFSGSGRSNQDTPASSELVAGLAGSPPALAPPAAALSPAEMRDENDRAGKFMVLILFAVVNCCFGIILNLNFLFDTRQLLHYMDNISDTS